MKSNHLAIANSVLPSFSGSRLTYNEKKNIILTEGYISAAGNTYFQGIRLSDRIVVSYQLGQGYCHLFLNGIRIYAFNGRELQLIAQDSYNCNYFSEENGKYYAQKMLENYLLNQAIVSGRNVEHKLVEELASSLINETHNKQTEILKLMSK